MFYIYVFQEDPKLADSLAKAMEDYKCHHTNFFIRKLEVIQDAFYHFNKRLPTPSMKHLYIIDVDFKGMDNGLALAKAIRQKDYLGYIIFLTSKDQNILKTFDHHLKAISYINKQDPNLKRKLYGVLGQICFENRLNLVDAETFTFKSNRRIVNLVCDDIEYIETTHMKRTLMIHTAQDQYVYHGTLKEILSELPDYFVRCHKSFVMNPKHIVELKHMDQQYGALLASGKSCLLSRKYIQEPIQLLEMKASYTNIETG